VFYSFVSCSILKMWFMSSKVVESVHLSSIHSKRLYLKAFLDDYSRISNFLHVYSR
jgi:hypothetical protein